MADGSRPGRALAALSALTGQRWKMGPARNTVSVERDVPVRMRDGAVLLGAACFGHGPFELSTGWPGAQ